LPGSTELLVQKGRVLVEGQLGMIKGGTKATFSNGSSFTAKLTKKDRDEFDDWSKERGEFLARANERLSIRTLNSYLFDSGWESGFSSSRYGLWTYSPFAGGFTFFPFRYGWSSPYGHHYGRCGGLGYGFGGGIGYYPVIVGSPPYGGWGGSGGSSGGWGSGGSTGGSGGSTGGGSGSGGSVGTPTRVAPSQPAQAGPAAPDPGGRARTRDPR